MKADVSMCYVMSEFPKFYIIVSTSSISIFCMKCQELHEIEVIQKIVNLLFPVCFFDNKR
jgi:hypothetical protein